MRVASLHVYPVKGMRAVDVEQAQVEPRGLAGDRRWLVVDESGEFLTQRSAPILAQATAAFDADELALMHDEMGTAVVPIPSGEERRSVVVWSSAIDAAAAPGADEWLTELLGKPVRLVFMDERALRMKESVWTPSPVPVSFADAFPVLVATTGSLAALNRAIEEDGGDPVPMRRFRPNVVVDCDEPWAEDLWPAIRIGEVVLDLVKPSDRCIVTTTDQATGERRGPQPLQALARVHRSKDPRINGVLFGVNAVPRALGRVSVGEPVKVVA